MAVLPSLALTALFVSGCGAAPGWVEEPSTKPAPTFSREHDLRAELVWARSASLAEVDEPASADDEREVRALARAIEASTEPGERGAEALFVVGRRAVERGDADQADRALRALLCPELAATPPLDGPLPPPIGADPWARCTPRTHDGATLAAAWRMFAFVWSMLRGDHIFGLAGYRRAAAHSIEGTPEHGRLGYEAGVASESMGELENALAWYGFALLSPDSGEVRHAETRLRILLVRDDWDEDGRKDRRSGVGRPEVARWLASRPAGAARALDTVITDLISVGQCAQAMRAWRALADLPGGPEVAARRRAEVGGCRTRR